jgi:hypothetical protein
MAGTIEANLAKLGITLPAPAAPVANYIGYNLVGNLLVVSGQIPFVNGKVAFTGKVGDSVSIEQGQEAARVCFINLVAQVKAACGGDLDRVKRVIRRWKSKACSRSPERSRRTRGPRGLRRPGAGQTGTACRTTRLS